MFKKSTYLLFVLIFSFLITTVSVQAADFRIGTGGNGSVNVKQNEEIKSLYSAGNIVSIDADVEKGIHAAGNVLTVNGDVGHSICLVGGTLITRGDVGGSVHGAGGNILIENKIEDDLILGGGNIAISEPAEIGGDLILGGGTVDLQGFVLGNAYMAGGVFVINGEIGGDLKITQADEIKLGSNAKINGNFEYNSTKEIEMEEGAVIMGETIILPKVGGELDKGLIAGMLFAIISVGILIRVIGLFLAGMLFIYFFRKFTEKTIKDGLSNFWQNLVTGFAVMVLTPIIAIILFGTIIGAWIGVILLIVFVLAMFVSGILANLSFGSWLYKAIQSEKTYTIDYKILIIGIISLTILSLIPVIGWLFIPVLTLLNLGTLYKTILKIK